MNLQKIISKNGSQYIFVKEYENYIMYKNMLTGAKECFNKQELGLIEKQKEMKYAKRHKTKF